jgi:glycosyltransferase involved in cell wall biosynthesis
VAHGAIVSSRPSVVYVLPDKMGGSSTIIANLLKYRTADEFTYRAVLTHNSLDVDTPLQRELGADSQITVEYALPLENIYAVARRLRRAIGSGPGILVCNDFVEMLLVTLMDPGRTVVQILHGDYDYYYDLASVHEPLVHAFVAYSRVVYERLLERLPHRRDTIFWLPYGIPLPEVVRQGSAATPLRLIFVGRLDEAKGVFLLPQIDRLLREAAVPITWTIVGSGPAGPDLHAAWRDPAHVRFVATATPGEVVRLCADHDVFVLPTRAEGLSVATVEAMGAGVVPVVTDLPGMVELAGGDRPGYRVPSRNPSAFADAIAGLARDRDLLEAMSAAARQLVVERFDIRARASAYQVLFASWRDLYRPRPALPVTSYGSRLDRPWLPNPVVRLVRTAMRAAR